MAHHPHSHSHAHSHDHSHLMSSASQDYHRAFAFSVIINLIFVIAEVIGALFANSMSLLADAGHNLGDVLGLALAGVANWLLTKNTLNSKYSYGYKKFSILAAVINAGLLVGTSAIIAYEAIRKLIHPEPVTESIVIIIALIGILINGGTALLFRRGSKDDLNVKGAFLHLLYDALISGGVVITGILIYFTALNWLDPLVSLLIVISIVWGSWALLRDSINMILDAVPSHVNYEKVREYLIAIPGVATIHDLHIWGLSTREVALTAHLIMPNASLKDEDFQKINHDLQHHFSIAHVTLQVEQGDHTDPCGQTEKC